MRTIQNIKKYVCKHCKVEVVSPTNTRAVLGREHAKKCPRRNQHA